MQKLNEKQEQIIGLRDHNILVSAAAGSGKTRVLVERIIGRLKDEKDPIDIDRFLVLTFTRAAAGEMRDRIATAIAKEIEKDPTEHMKKQAALIYNAKITTIDSFCLDVVRNNFTEIGLEPGFRPANDAELAILGNEAMDETIEDILATKDIPYLDEFLERFRRKDSLRDVRAAIETVYKEACKAPFIEDYLEDRRKDYAQKSIEELTESKWMQEYLHEIHEYLQYVRSLIDRLWDDCESMGPESMLPAIEADGNVVDELLRAQDYDGLKAALSMSPAWMRLPNKKADEDPEIREAAKNRRNLYKDLIKKKVYDKVFLPEKAELLRMTEHNDRIINAMLDVVLRYHRCFEAKKRDKGLISFSDMEHMALQILLKKTDEGYVPSDIAEEYRGSFKEIMVDEYQDSNYMQEWIIRSISDEDAGVYDRFMVGDVKQSIYRFRSADPRLFMEKYYEYGGCDNDNGRNYIRVDLSSNYRSRREVLDSVNAVFEHLMEREIGGVDYDDDNRLYYGGSYDEAPIPADTDTYKTELLLIEQDDDSKLNKYEQEAMVIADRIKRLVGHHKVYDKDKKILRDCTYRDIVILTRDGNDIMDGLRSVFEAQDIPAYAQTKGGYFDALEIETVLALLSVIDNPYNEIPMIETLRSVFAGFTDEEAALIKIIRQGNLYEGIKYLASADIDTILSDREELSGLIDETIRDKAAGFLAFLNRYRDMVPYTPIYKLLRLIFDETDYVEYVSALPGGEQKKANVLALLSKAEGFTEDGFRGIFDFNRYIERLHSYQTEEGEVVALDENADVVRIMTMHKSKGLEFPVCILAGLSKQFYGGDQSSGMIFHEEYGMGLKYVDSARHIKCHDLRRDFIYEMSGRDSISEEMRLLYVAMTRAKEKLIMTSITGDADDLLSKYPFDHPNRQDKLNASSHLEMILMSRGKNDWNGQCMLKRITPEDIDISELEDAVNMAERRREIGVMMTDLSGEDEHVASVVSGVKNKINIKYPRPELQKLYTKTSVSELKMASIHDRILDNSMEELPKEFFKLHEESTYIPDFARTSVSEATGAMRGSAYHRVMELLDMAVWGDGDGNINPDIQWLDMQMDKKINDGVITSEEYALVDKNKIITFFTSDLGKRMCKAAKEGRLYREKPFVLGVSADRLDPSFPVSETVLIQGIIDAYFIEGDKVIIMDYKTDSVKSGKELTDRYKTQLDYYDEALTRILSKEVSERLIYSFSLEETINL